VFHTCAYSFLTGAVAFTDSDMVAVSDQAVTISNGHFIFTQDAFIVGAYVLGTTVLRGKIQTPKTRQIANPYLRPVERATTVPNKPEFCDLSGDRIPINRIDETQFLLSGNPGVAETDLALLWVSDGNLNATPGPVQTIRATTVVTTVASVWTNTALVFDQVLPAGLYTVVGLDAYATGLLGARLVFQTQVWRPGAIVTPSAGLYNGDYFHRGYMGNYGTFASVAQPTVDFFSIAAATNPDVFLDIIKVG